MALSRKQVEKIRDKVLPMHAKMYDALLAVPSFVGIKVSMKTLQRDFRKHLGVLPGGFLGSGLSDEPVESENNVVILKRRISALEKEVKAARQQDSISHIVKSMVHDGLGYDTSHPSWLGNPGSKKQKIYHGVPTLLLSDWHHGEVIRAEQVDGSNEFDIEISHRRVRRLFDRMCYLANDVFVKSEYPGVVLALGGDLVSGNIHDEIRETNEIPIFDAVLDAVDCLERGIEVLRQEFGKVFVPCVVGNHGRIDKKPRMKMGPQDNYEYILYHLLARRYAKDPRVRVVISDSFTLNYRVFGTRVMLMHGDSMRGGSGISGPLIPWSLGDHKMRKQRSTMEAWTGVDVGYDLLTFGHWHTYFPGRSFVANGSICGFNEYAKKMGFSFEPPQQAMWMTNPQYGVTFQAAVFAEDPGQGAEAKSHWVSFNDGGK